ncbi:bifunctional riboflavin kinase/FAD synthetase [Limnobacter sp.]|uniref:bifunctional riboflavin kinase/FAD synthetase n=1 Tax=Limnobacter sp. TaxID=2003368 RepID=UPI0035191285
MKITRRPGTSHQRQGTALTIGNFDGVHQGHAALFARVVKAAQTQGLVPTVVTLHPHPKEFFSPEFKLSRISTLRDRIIEMKRCGIEQVCILPFNKSTACLSPQAFVQEVLVRQLNAKQVWVGDDFRFGAKRAGDFELLKALGSSHGFTVSDLAEVQSNGSRVSSSNIREALQAGDVPRATHMLGHPLVYSGHIVHGKKLGRTLGFPTMNLRIAGRASALTGILAVWVHGLGPSPLPAVASMGVRPTVEQSDQILLETFIPNWQGNAYGKLLRIEVLAHIRPEQHFDSLDTMVEQMHQDTTKAMALLAAAQPRITHTGC